jgi:acetyltransferase-like isoleucine patch superfamily enzyme
MKNLIFLVISFLPRAVKIFVLNKCFKCEIHPTAKIGLSFVKVKKIKMGPNAKIGNFNIIRNLELLDIGENATIGTSNYVTAIPLGSKQHFTDEESRFPALILGKCSGIVKKHFFDCNNTITIGHYTLIAGFNSAFFTHGVSIQKCKQVTTPVEIGNYCMIATHCTVTKGAKLPNCSILAASSTLHKTFEEPYRMYSGVPAQPVKVLEPDNAYFHRKTNYIA